MRRVLRAAVVVSIVAGIPAGARAQSPLRGVVDIPEQDVVVRAPFGVAGWTLDLTSTTGSGVDAVQMWAYPLVGGVPGMPRFVGFGTLGVSRPDVAGLFGSQFENSGYLVIVPRGLPAGTYLFTLFARQAGGKGGNGLISPARGAGGGGGGGIIDLLSPSNTPGTLTVTGGPGGTGGAGTGQPGSGGACGGDGGASGPTAGVAGNGGRAITTTVANPATLIR